MPLHNFPALSVQLARKQAQFAYERVCEGLSPRAQEVDDAPVQVITLKAFYDQHYQPYALLHKQSPANEFSMLSNHFLSAFGDQPLNGLSPLQLAHWVIELRQKLSPGSVNVVIFAARALFNLALDLEMPGVTSNPMHKVKALKVNNGREVFLNPEEVARLLQAAEASRQTYLPALLRLYLLTGLRKNELLRLRWSHIDWERLLLTLPENKSGHVRRVPLSPTAADILKAVAPLPDCPYVFANPKTGRPLQSINHAFIKVRNAAGLSHVTLHDLRHTFASTLVNEGGYLLHEAQQILGHKDIRMTQRYAHLAQPTLQKAVCLAAERLLPAMTSATPALPMAA